MTDTKDPCPEWCVTDHDKPVYQDGRGIGVHMGAKTVIQPAGQVARIAVYLASGHQSPAVNVHAVKYGDPMIDGFLVPQGPEALALAVLVEVLADATLEQHRQLADAIRQAAALETGTEAGA